MSTRCRHDLNGCVTQLRSALNQWREAQATAAESWSDETARKFHDENLSEADSTISRVIAALQEAAEVVRNIEKKVADDRVTES